MSALSWAKDTHKLKSALNRRAYIFMMQLCFRKNIEITEIIHVKGEDNVVCDKLSRGASAAELGWVGDIIEPGDEWLEEILELCDPTLPCDTEPLFTVYWSRLNTWFDVVDHAI